MLAMFWCADSLRLTVCALVSSERREVLRWGSSVESLRGSADAWRARCFLRFFFLRFLLRLRGGRSDDALKLPALRRLLPELRRSSGLSRNEGRSPAPMVTRSAAEE